MSALVDTSCLLRLSGENDPREAATQMAMDTLAEKGRHWSWPRRTLSSFAK